MSDLATEIRKGFEREGDTGVWVWRIHGRAVEVSSPFGFLVHYESEPEEWLHKLVPMGVGWQGLIDWMEAALDDALDYEQGDAFTIELVGYDAEQLSEIDCST